MDDEDIIELSPFTVSAEENQGYQATSTLAGTRIKTDINDLGAAISVVTKEFMEDTGATSLEDLFQYTTSTEIGGLEGNFSAANIDAGGGRVDQDETRREPQAGGRIRGLARPNYTRNYFTTSIPIDRYNTGQITISRGPNSLLFGLGSAGGVVDAGLGLATLGRDNTKMQFRFDNEGSTRSEFDVNRTLIDDRLALRLAGVYEDKQFRQEEATKLTRRLYGAIDAVLYRASDRDAIIGDTKLRGNFEIGEESMTPPDALPPSQAWDSFFRPPQDFRPYSGKDYRQGFDHLTANWVKWGTLDARRIDNGDGTYTPGYNELATPLHSTPHIFTQLGLVFGGGPGEGPTVINAAESVGIEGWIPGGISGSSAWMNPFLNTRSYHETDGSAGFKNFSLINRDIFDSENHLITGSLQEIDKTYDAQTISLEQELFGGRGGIELTYGLEYYRLERYQPFGGGGRNLPIYIDTTEYLNDGEPNPNVGRAFLLGQGDIDEWRRTHRENARATAFYNLDFTEFGDNLITKFLGRHTFTGLYQEEDRENYAVQYGMYWGPTGGQDFKRDVWGREGNVNDTSFAGQLVQFAYISDDLRGVEYEDVRLYPANYQRVRDGDIYKMQYYDAQDRVYKNGNFQVNRYARRAGPNNATRTNVESDAFAWQSYLLNSNIVGLAGWRTDEISSYGAKVWRPDVGNRTLDVDKALEVADDPNSVQKGDTFTWSVVAHMPQKWIDRVPWFSSMSAHYGDSENFSTIKQRNDINNNPIPNPAGVTEEMGISLGWNDDRWLLRLTKYETSQAFADLANDPSFGSINEITRALNNYQDAKDNGIPFDELPNTGDVTSYDDMFNRIIGLLPAETQAIYQYGYDAEAGEWDNESQIEGLAATTDLVAEGYELELVGNPTPNWRVLLNVAQTETIRSNSGDATHAFQQNHLAALDAAGLTNVNESPNGIVVMGARYNNTWVAPLIAQRAKDGQVSQEQRKYRVNLVNNYNFREGRFKGFGVGGAIRWQSDITTGYQVILDEFGNQLPDLDNPFKGPEEFNADVWVSYNRKIGEKLNWKIQLNVRNLIGSNDPIPVFTNPDGQDAVFRLAPGTSWFVTNTFTF